MTQDHDAAVAESQQRMAEESGVAPVPEDNQPGHHPDEEQDKPTIP